MTQNMIEQKNSVTQEFHAGDVVIYGLVGKCKVESIVSRQIGSETILFYELTPNKGKEKKRPQNPFIPKTGVSGQSKLFIPVNQARTLGLRYPMTSQDVPAVMDILSSEEYYFPLKLEAKEANKLIEKAIEKEGPIGLAKAASYLKAKITKEIGVGPEFSKLFQLVLYYLIREIADANEEPLLKVEARITQTLLVKTQIDH